MEDQINNKISDNLLYKTKNKSNKLHYFYNLLGLIPVVSSSLCAIYIVYMYNNVDGLIEDIDFFKRTVLSINETKMQLITDNLLKLEDCILSKIQICNGP